MAFLLAVLALQAPVRNAPAQTAGDAPLPASQVLLRIHGSNTIGDALMPALVKTFLEQELHYSSVLEALPPGRKAAKDESYLVARSSSGDRWVEIFSHGSGTGFTDLLNGTADIWMSSDVVDAKQIAALKPVTGDPSSPAGEHIIALDGIAVIVPPANPLSQLSASQLADIFSGRRKDWSEVGGAPGPIHVYARDNNSGTYKFFTSAVLAGTALTPAARRIEKSEDLSHAVQADPRGIGFIGLNYVSGNKAVRLTATENGRALPPDVCTVKTEEYLLARRLYLYTATHPRPLVARFIQFATSEAAWPVVNRIGLVSTDPTPLKDQAGCGGGGRIGVAGDDGAQGHSAEYRALTRDRRRLLTNFNFVSGRATLDNRAYQDVGYLVDLLSAKEYAGHRILLIGYADGSGSFTRNMEISVQRANTVNGALGRALAGRTSVVISMVAGLGAQDFLRGNDTESDREKNRRVEAWIE